MPDQANEFLKDYQAFAQQSWDAWMRYLQQQGQPAPFAPFGMGAPAAPQNDLLARSLSSLKAYGSWLQQAAGAGLGQMPMGNWQQPTAMQSFLTAFNQPFAQTVAGIDSASAFGLDHQWQSWLQAMQQNAGTFTMPSQMATFGITREVQLDQQALTAAMQQYAQINARYQGLLQKVNTQGIARLQEMLSQQAETGTQVQSLKALYDLWVDAMEEAYAAMAMSDEYREVFGALANAQMHVRKLQQEQTEHMCRELGIPTRSEVDSLGKRLQEIRRQLKSQNKGGSAVDASLVDTLQAEIASLRRELAASKATKVHSIERKASDNGKTASPSRRAKATRSATGKRK